MARKMYEVAAFVGNILADEIDKTFGPFTLGGEGAFPDGIPLSNSLGLFYTDISEEIARYDATPFNEMVKHCRKLRKELVESRRQNEKNEN